MKVVSMMSKNQTLDLRRYGLDDIVTVDEAAQLLSMSRKSFLNLANGNAPKIRTFKTKTGGRALRYRDVLEFANLLPTTST